MHSITWEDSTHWTRKTFTVCRRWFHAVNAKGGKMKKLPKKCLTCKFAELDENMDIDDEQSLLCSLDGEEVEDDFVCSSYELNKAVA